MKKQVLHAYTHFDILGCQVQADQTLEKLLFSTSRKVQEQTIAFINTLCSEGIARSYLLKKANIVEQLVQIIRKEPHDT